MLDKQKSNIYLCEHFRKKSIKARQFSQSSSVSFLSSGKQHCRAKHHTKDKKGLNHHGRSWLYPCSGFAIDPSPISAVLKGPTSKNSSLPPLSFNTIIRLWSFYVSHMGIEAACAVMSGGVDVILYHHRANLDVLFSYCDRYLRSYFLLDPQNATSLFLFFSLFYIYKHVKFL